MWAKLWAGLKISLFRLSGLYSGHVKSTGIPGLQVLRNFVGSNQHLYEFMIQFWENYEKLKFCSKNPATENKFSKIKAQDFCNIFFLSILGKMLYVKIILFGFFFSFSL
jgi:hypothetical protein